MRRLSLLLVLLAILIDVAQSSCSTPKRKCINKGNKFGVSAYCELKSIDCPGRLFRGEKFCNDHENCGCCVPKKGRNVNAAFKLSPEIYTEALTNHSSAQYLALAKRIKDEVKDFSGFLNVKIEFFRDGSVISGGEANSVIVDLRVTTDKKKQKWADNFVKDMLKNSNIPGLVDSSVSVGVRLCVPGYKNSDACANMKAENPKLNIICVQARDRYECIQMLNEEEVDVVRGDAEDIYLANEMYGAHLSVVAETRDNNKKDDTYQNRIVAVVRRSKITNIGSLAGSKFCSTGYDTTSGWFVPLSKLSAMGKLTFNGIGSVLNQNLEAFSSFFGSACLPGQWGPINETSNVLKSVVYPNLCNLCGGTDCMAPAGPEGALQCLNSGGDVAWIDLEAVDISSFGNSEEFGFLCTNGIVESIDTVHPCTWAEKPWPGWLIRADEKSPKVIVSALKKATKVAQSPIKDWAKDVLGITKHSVIIELTPLSPYEHLNQGRYYVTINEPGCEGVPVKFCATSDIALHKCTELAQVLKSRRVRPLLECVEEDDCPKAVEDKTADFVPLDGGIVFESYRDHELTPVVSEVYGKHAASYFAVAVVRASSGITKLADLKGKNSCHTGIDKTAGWKMPLKALLDANLLKKEKPCDYPKQIGNFFNESCVPGAKSPKYPQSLCDLCIGNGNGSYVCDKDPKELFNGYSGAFRCLVEGGGDVAFVKHTTVPDNTKPECEEPDWCWTQKSSDYRLLCKDNTTKPVEDYLQCNLAEVPSHMVVTRNNTDDDRREDIRNVLLLASAEFPRGNDVFDLFGDYGTYPDILFKNSATSLINLSEAAFDDMKEETYWQALKTLENCGIPNE